jgi:hypothetical protein
MTLPDEGSARCKGLYLTTHTTLTKDIPPAEFEPATRNPRKRETAEDPRLRSLCNWNRRMCIFPCLILVSDAATRDRCDRCHISSRKPGCTSQWLNGLLPISWRVCRFVAHRGHGYLFFASVVCCQVEVSATGRFSSRGVVPAVVCLRECD